jgi:SAM-dependent methyltransferase
MGSSSAQRSANDKLWARGDLVRHYVGDDLRPVELVLLNRYGDELSGRVLEIGSGAGRLTAPLGRMASEMLAFDVNPHMLEALGASLPHVQTELRDMREMDDLRDSSFDAVVAGYNVADVLDHDERSTFLSEVRRILAPGGMLIMSSHNVHSEHRITEPLRFRMSDPRSLAALLLRGPKWRRNRRRLLPHERRERDYSILNDMAHDFGALHYYIDRDAQERQLTEHQFEFVECLDLDGQTVGPGEHAAETTELHYVARTTS